MAYKYEKETGDIVISGWERGISTSPHQGLGDLKCLNISTMPGEVSVNYDRVQQSQQPITGGTIMAGGTGFVSYSGSPTLLQGTWITISGSTISGLSNGVYYVLLNASPTGIQLSNSYKGSQLTGFGLTGSATFTTFNMGKPIGYAYSNVSSFPNYKYFVLDSNGLVWENEDIASSETTISQWSLIQTAPVSGTTGIFCFGEYVFIAADKLYYKGLTALGTGWATFQTINLGFPHPSVTTPSGLLVLGDASQLDTLMAIGTFDPTAPDTYTWVPAAILLPGSDYVTTLALIGNGSAATGGTGGATNILIGGISNLIYPWAPGTTFFQPAIFISESYTQQMITVNNLVYVFAGSKGNIYITNGSSFTSVISVPDYIANSTGANQDPFFIWGGAMYLRGRIWFSVQAQNCGGIFSFIPTINYYPQQDVGMSLRLEHQNSYGTYAGLASILFAPQLSTAQNAEGVQYFAGWDDGTFGASANPYGIDFSGTTPYTNAAAIIETDLIPTGTMLKEQTFGQIEYKLSAPLASITATVPIASGTTSVTLITDWVGIDGTQMVTFSDGETRIATFTNGATTMTWSGGLTNAVTAIILVESITIKWRTSLSSNWNTTGADMFMNPSNTAGYFVPDFEFTQWIQLQTTLQSTTNNPSYCRLKEIRIRQ